MPLAEIAETGGRFCLDTYAKRNDEENAIRYLDHEAYYGAYCDPDNTEVYASTPTEMILKWLTAPVSTLLADWRGVKDGELWLVEGRAVDDKR